MAVNIRLIDLNQVFPISGRLASHFSSDTLTARQIGIEYRSAERILLNPDKFPRADTATLEWLSEALFDLSATAALA